MREGGRLRLKGVQVATLPQGVKGVKGVKEVKEDEREMHVLVVLYPLSEAAPPERKPTPPERSGPPHRSAPLRFRILMPGRPGP